MPRYVSLKEFFQEMVNKNGMNTDKEVMAYMQGARYLLLQEPQSREMAKTLGQPANGVKAGELFVYDLERSKGNIDSYDHHTFLIGLQLLLDEVGEGFEKDDLHEAVAKFPKAYQRAKQLARQEESTVSAEEKDSFTLKPKKAI